MGSMYCPESQRHSMNALSDEWCPRLSIAMRGSALRRSGEQMLALVMSPIQS